MAVAAKAGDALRGNSARANAPERPTEGQPSPKPKSASAPRSRAQGGPGLIGVPFPLFSYGGSALVTALIAIGLLMNVSMRRYVF